MLKYGLMNNPALVKMARIDRAADISADIEPCPQGAGLKSIASGFSIVHGLDDQKKIRLETPVHDALYDWCGAQAQKA